MLPLHVQRDCLSPLPCILQQPVVLGTSVPTFASRTCVMQQSEMGTGLLATLSLSHSQRERMREQGSASGKKVADPEVGVQRVPHL